MKIKKLLFLSLFFIIGLLLFMPSKVNATVTLDRVLNIDGADLVPIIGRTPGTLSDGKYYEVVSQIWREENGTLLTGNFEEGKNYTYELTIKQKEGYEFSDDVFFNFKNIEWLEDGHGVSNSEGIAFFSGKCKSVKIHKLTITADEGINVSPVGTMDIYTGYSKEIILESKSGYDLVSVKVNGDEKISSLEEKDNITTQEGFNFVKSLNVKCEDSDLNVVIETLKTIAKVEVNGANLPVIGGLPVVDGLSVPSGATYEIVDAVWGTFDKEKGPDTTFEKMQDGEMFEEGKSYSLKIELHSLNETVPFSERMIPFVNNMATGGSRAFINNESSVYNKLIIYFDVVDLRNNYFLNNTEDQELILEDNKNLNFDLEIKPYYIIEGKIYIDSVEVPITNIGFDRIENEYGYEVSTKVRIMWDYIENLDVGSHLIKFVFVDGRETETTFTIKKPYKLILDANEGVFSDGKTKMTFDDVTKCDITKVENPVRDGYAFKGWFTEEKGGLSLESIMSSEDGIDKDMTFYAQWEEIKVDETDKDEGNTPSEDNKDDNTGNTIAGSGTGSSLNNTDANKPTGNNPQTGDNIVLFAIISLIAVIGIIITIKVKKYVKE